MASPLINNPVLVSALAVCGLCGLLAVGVCRSHRLWCGAMKGFLAWLPLRKAVFILFGTIATALAQKSGTNVVNGVDATNGVVNATGTNEVGNAARTNGMDGAQGEVPPPQMMLGSVRPTEYPELSLVVLSPHDALRDYRLDFVTTNEAVSYDMPTNAATCGTWRLTGAYDDVVRVGLGEFRFPLGTNLYSSLWAHTWGTARPKLRNFSNELVAVGVPLSAIPGVSRFWTEQTTNATFLLTWQDFAIGRPLLTTDNQQLTTLSAQLELRGNGDFIARSNGVESVYRRVNPDDWDDDGIPNEEDVNPFFSNGDCFGPHQVLPEGANSNAYCWVDIVVHQANARVAFSGDGSSDLPDPSFVARAEEINRVALLIGKTYKVTCAMPFTVVGKSDPAIDEWWENDNTLWLNWPVDIWAVGDEEDVPLLLGAPLFGASGGGNGFTMRVVPDCLFGDFVWTNCCCSISGGGCHYSYNCAGGCSCGGCCATGYYLYEGYRLSALGGSCGCSYVDEPDDPHGDPPDDPLPPKGVFVSFSKKVIFLEDEYANTPSNVVPWYSDTSSLCCFGNGGAHGGRIHIEISGSENLIQFGGQPLPFERELEPFEVVAFTNTYKAVSESSGYEAIVVTATFAENDTGWSETSIAKATAVRVEVTTQDNVNDCIHRHVWGLGELVNCEWFPNSAPVFVEGLNGGVVGLLMQVDTLTCPLSAASPVLKISCNSCEYVPESLVVEPLSIEARNARQIPFDVPIGWPGGVGFAMDLFIKPDHVSFKQLSFVEDMSTDDTIDGYFTNEVFSAVWHHTPDRGACEWHDVQGENFFFTDRAAMGDVLVRPWYAGVIAWRIPIKWRGKGDINGQTFPLPPNIDQVFTISDSGCLRVSKCNLWVERDPDGTTRRSEGVSNDE